MRYARWVLFAVLVAGTACGGGGGEDGNGGGNGAGTTTDTVTLVDNAFEPSDPVVDAGSTLALVNEGAASHTFTLADQDIDETLEAGAESSVEISLEAGTYDFDCSFHPEMSGTLTVQ